MRIKLLFAMHIMLVELRNWLQRTENIRRTIHLPAVFSTVIHSNHHCHKIHNMF